MSTHARTFKRSLKETQKSFQNDTQVVKHECVGMDRNQATVISHPQAAHSLSPYPKTSLWKYEEHTHYPSGYIV